MKASGGKTVVIAAALTWDGARCPIRYLPEKAKAFLAAGSNRVATPSVRAMAQLAVNKRIHELRICWVPRLKGGPQVLSAPFFTPSGSRLKFQSVKATRIGDVLAVIYRPG